MEGHLKICNISFSFKFFGYVGGVNQISRSKIAIDLNIIYPNYLIRSMPVFYCKQEDFEGCPYRLIDLEKPHPLCRYIELTAQLIIDREFSGISGLTSKACDWIKQDEARSETIRRIARENGLDVINNAKVGDMLFCLFGRFQGREVKLLEKPLNGSIFAKCQAPNGELFEMQPILLRRIAKGYYCGEFFVKGIENEERATISKNKANYYGFRADVEKKTDGFLLKIYGESKEQVEDFIFMVLEQNLELERFLAGPRRPIH